MCPIRPWNARVWAIVSLGSRFHGWRRRESHRLDRECAVRLLRRRACAGFPTRSRLEWTRSNFFTPERRPWEHMGWAEDHISVSLNALLWVALGGKQHCVDCKDAAARGAFRLILPCSHIWFCISALQGAVRRGCRLIWLEDRAARSATAALTVLWLLILSWSVCILGTFSGSLCCGWRRWRECTLGPVSLPRRARAAPDRRPGQLPRRLEYQLLVNRSTCICCTACFLLRSSSVVSAIAQSCVSFCCFCFGQCRGGLWSLPACGGRYSWRQ